ncbi:autotransporter assembly complex protein TamA [Ideonella alba]|uniref:BamA/TamA family outer membrane protein n=1 Tax=Ideonella alba TaxID=2824118 RepID=A0A940YAU2_9BURK|nr:BamA/TamA family outer membrane protein [Ideonella alba]MBQ0931776.1 BamA/TamA family outer membrane protein [Ideonella alba]
MSRRARLAAALWALAAAPWVALAQPAAPDATASAPDATQPAADTAVSGGKVPRLRIEAPGAVRELLEKHLDLARAIAQPDAASFSDLEWSRLIGSAPAQARQLVQPLGLFRAQAEVQRADDGTLTLRITPGEAAQVSRLTFEWTGELVERAERGDSDARTLQQGLSQRWPLAPGSTFTNTAWSEAKNAVIASLRAQGYAAASWAGTAAEVDAELTGVRLFLVADSGPLFRAGVIAVSGLTHQQPERARALAPFDTGAALTEQRLLDYQTTLLKTGLYESVNVGFDPDPSQAGAATVNVQLHEAPRQAATVGVGYSANTGPRISLEHVQRRLFDRDLSLRNKLLWGASEQSWDGELSTHPDRDYRRWVLGGTLDRTVGDTDTVLLQRLRVGRSTDRGGIERFVHVDADRSRECASGLAAGTCQTLSALSLQADWTMRRVDNALLPTRGYTVQLGLGLGAADGSDSARGSFGRVQARATGYWPIGQSWYSQLRLEAGQVLMRDDVQVPDALRFRAGGDESVRGYAWRSLAPTRADGSLTGGRVLATASAEIARPVSAALPSVWWAAFVDAGRASDSWRGFSPALGYGLGVRWRSPVGPLKLDLAYGQEVRSARLHLSVGIAF